jgi:hypothetical protein
VEKAILVLDGISEGKTAFIDIAKEAGYWIWNINHRNVLSMLAGKIGWDGNRNNNFYDFVKDFDALANKYFNYEEWYTLDMINKFIDSENTNILIIHNCNCEISSRIQEEFENCYTVCIDKEEKENSDYCKRFNFSSDNFKESVLSSLEIITNNKEK